jgi:hypothetical protein
MTVPNTEDAQVLEFSNTRALKKQHDAMVRWAQEQYRMIRNARTTTEQQWYLNLAFFFGRQHVVPDRRAAYGVTPRTTRLVTPPAPYYRSRPVINRVRSTIRTELAHLTNNRPNAMVVPASAEDRDMYAALAGEQIWSNFYTNKRLKAVLRRAMWWTLTCGTGFVKNWWDFSLEDVMFKQETPFHILCPDFREEELEEQPFLIHALTRTPEYIKMHFKKALDGSEVDPNKSEAQDIMDETFINLVGTQNSDRQRNVLVLEVWVKAGVNPLFPEGAFFTVVGDKIVQGYQQWPYSHNKFPYAKFDHIPGAKFYGTSLIEDLIPLQKEYNRTRGQIIEAKNRMAKPQLVAARGSVDATKITTEPGQVIFYTPGFDAPTPIPLSPLPSYVLQEIDRILTDWSDIAGQHEITKGQVPPGVTAATAISYLQERDESKLTPTFDSLEEGIEKLAQMSLSYVKDYYGDERIIRVTGPEGSFDTMAFKGSDLNNDTDIRIEAGSSLPQSKAAKQAFIMDMMKMGFIDPQKGLEVMDMGGINKIYEQIQVDQRQAQRENLRMSKVTEQLLEESDMLYQQNIEQVGGDPTAPPPLIVPVNTYDNHKVHIEVHNNYRKGQAFEVLPQHVKKLFEQHVQSHIIAMGMETITMDPRQAAGLPPELPSEEQEQIQQENPGPEPMPEMGMM